MTPTGARTCPTTARTRPSSPSKETDPASRNSWGVDMNRNFQDGSVFDGFQGASATRLHERQLRRPVRALGARGPQRDVGADDVPQHQVRQQHPLLRRPASCGRPARTRRARVPLPYPPYGTLNFFDQTGKERPGRHQVAPRHGDPCRSRPVRSSTCSTRPPATRADEAYYGNGIIGFDFEIGDQQLLQEPDDRREHDLRRRPAAAVRRLDERLPRQRGLPRGAWSSPAATTASSRRRWPTPTTRRRRSSRRPATSVANVHAERPLHQQRGVVDLLHDRRLDADHGLDRVEAEPRAGALPLPGRDRRRRHAEVDREGLQGQRLRGAVQDVHDRDRQADGDPQRVRPRARCSRRAGRSRSRYSLRGRGRRLRASRAASARRPAARNLPTSTAGHVHLHGDRDRQRRQRDGPRAARYTVLTATNSQRRRERQRAGHAEPDARHSGDQFGAFTPGVTRTYLASTTANVISTAGDALLSVVRPELDRHRPPGQRRVLPGAAAPGPGAQRRQHRHRVQQRRLSASPLNLLSWNGPISNDALTIEFSQLINANDAAPHGDVLEGADVHAEHDSAVGRFRYRAPASAGAR